MQTLVHLSDLHVGRDAREDADVARLAAALSTADVDHVVVTGDLTHRGRRSELATFHRAFEPLARAGRLTVVPGNHDRLTDDVGRHVMAGKRVAIEQRLGLHLVRVDSTGPHNRSLITGHGQLDARDIEDCARAVDAAPRGALVCVLMHHHPLPLPVEDLAERFATWCRRPWAAELQLGRRLLDVLAGRCDLLLHGHRHIPSEAHPFPDLARPLGVFNAGATPRLGRVRMFLHRAGHLVSGPRWIDLVPGLEAGAFERTA